MSSESRVANRQPASSNHQLSDEVVRRVLERAVEIDALRPTRVTTDQLREIALEAGISPEALEQAIVEVERNATRTGMDRSGADGERWLKGLRGVLRSAVIGVGGFGLGVIARALFGATGASINIEQFVAVILLAFASTEFAFQHSGRGTHTGFQRDNAALWSSFTVGWSIVHGFFWGELVGATLILWLSCGIAGSAVIAWRRNGR